MRRVQRPIRTGTFGEYWDRIVDARELETVRQQLRRELRVHGSQRALATEIGISRGTLRKFERGESTPDRVSLAKLTRWAEDRPGLELGTDVLGLALLMEELPPTSRPRSRKRVATVLRAEYLAADLQVPKWISDEIQRGDLSEAAAGTGKPPHRDRVLLLRIRALLEDYPDEPPTSEDA